MVGRREEADIGVKPGPAAAPPSHPGALDLARVREDFPILGFQVRGKPLIYLDSAATTQKPLRVIEATTSYYEHDNSNIHRGVYWLSQKATEAFEAARVRAARFLNAAEPREIVFCRGTTEAINLVANSWGAANLRAGDELLLTVMEHHSNIVPWQLLARRTGARIRVAPISDQGELDLAAFEGLLSDRTRLVGVVHVSNALGTVNPVKCVVELAHAAGAKVLLDGAQAVAHVPVDVRELGCDFYAFSGHKLYGPTGIGCLYAKAELLESMPPWQGGGDMIRSVSFEGSTWNDVPHKFEAGTPDIAGAIGLAAALDYFESLGADRVFAHEDALLAYATEVLSMVPGLRVIGTAREKVAVISFVFEGVHPHDVGTVLDKEGIAIRTGHHCAQPLMERFGVPATARLSLALYNSREDVDALALALGRVREFFA